VTVSNVVVTVTVAAPALALLWFEVPEVMVVRCSSETCIAGHCLARARTSRAKKSEFEVAVAAVNHMDMDVEIADPEVHRRQ
jgi:hypothetical protein